MTQTPERVYFTVLDPGGKAYPAVAYWAGALDDRQPVYQVVQLKRFIKLIGLDEPLAEVAEGVFEGAYTKQTFTRFPASVDSQAPY